jgi:hypothetical protein
LHKGKIPSTGFFQRRMPKTGILHFEPSPAMDGSNRPGDVGFSLSEPILAQIIRHYQQLFNPLLLSTKKVPI